MAEKVFQTNVKKEKGFIYFCKEEDGCICVFKAKCGRKKVN